MKPSLLSDLIAAWIAIFALVVLCVCVLPGYFERDSEPTRVEKVTDDSRGMTNFPCPLTKEGC